ncbi:MAG TPA: 50S ribosomal protein L29 [Pseudomonadota bacterium]|jgi:large subunit ribosomal protein L29|nr:50S ribosomal protein L29 [Pseudomonadota bacterium]
MKLSAVLREMKESTSVELEGRLGRLERRLFQLRLKHSTNQLEDSSQIRTTRREVARVMTLLAERRRGASES